MDKFNRKGWIELVSGMLDVALALLCCWISAKITAIFRPEVHITYQIYISFACLILFFFYMFDFYNARENRRADTFVSVALSALAADMIVLLLNLIFEWHCRTTIFWLLTPMILFAVLELWRFALSFLLVRIRGTQKILIIESCDVTSRLARKLKYSCNNLSTAWYIIIDENDPEEVRDLMDNLIQQYDCILLSSALSETVRDEVLNHAMVLNKYVDIIPTFQKVSIMNGTIVQFGDTPVIQINTLGISRIERFVKRTVDLIISTVMLVCISPLLLGCAVAIKLDSPGPVIYKQERYTIHKKRFYVYKFRTMRQDAEKSGAQLAAMNDTRITRVGRVLRALRFDEFPQLVNVLSGAMSLVGPRPERPVFADEFSRLVRSYDMRYFVKAGLTGYAQVYGKYNTRASDKILMDIIYINYYSFWLDVKMLLLTVRTMFIRESTEGVNEAWDAELNTIDREQIRRRRKVGQV